MDLMIDSEVVQLSWREYTKTGHFGPQPYACTVYSCRLKHPDMTILYQYTEIITCYNMLS